MKSLMATGNPLANTAAQLHVLEDEFAMVPFQQKLEQSGLYPLKPLATAVFQVNIGKMCNQVCRHCHVDAGPDRREIMTRETMQLCLEVLQQHPSFSIVDITGGAPEMNPDFRWFVEEIKKLDRHVIVRCNLTIILANKKYYDLPLFYKKHGLEVVSSLPFYTKDRTDRQRGNGVFEASVQALKMLNEVGYGQPDSDLMLNLVFNPSGAFLPASQTSLETEYKRALEQQFGIVFHHLFVITNMPISRYLNYLLETGNYEKYMQKLSGAYNAVAAVNVMCRNTISVGWDGYLYDCDFNQMLDLKVACASKHIADYNDDILQSRHIIVGQHCFGCTAGAGSSCGGATA